jgi:hypothetical protein
MILARTRLWGSALAVCLLAGAAQAGPVGVTGPTWSYSWTPSTLRVAADGNSTTSYIQVISESAGLAQGSASVGAVNLPTSSTAQLSNPATFTNAPLSLNLTLTDTKTNAQGNLKFSGTFNGWLASSQAFLTWTPTTSMTQSVTISGNKYTVTLSVAPPVRPGALVPGAITAVAQVSVSTGGGSNPEPSTLLLSGLGVTGVGVGCWLRRRRVRQAALTLA